MNKVIIDTTIFTVCRGCGHLNEHVAEVHSTLHFNPSSPDKSWMDELKSFTDWLETQDCVNFHEAYIKYLTGRN